MKVTAIFKQKNTDFDEQLAQEQFKGKESEDNVRFWWEDEIVITSNIVDIKIVEHTTYPLRGTVDGKDFHYDIPNMKIWELHDDQGNITPLAISYGLLMEFNESDTNDTKTFEFIFTDQEVIHNPVPGVYMDVADYPEELT